MNKEKKIALYLVGKELERAARMQETSKLLNGKKKQKRKKKRWKLVEYRMTMLYRKMLKAYSLNEKGCSEEEIIQAVKELEEEYFYKDCKLRGF